MEEVSAEQLVLIDLAGHRLDGERPIHREWPIHASIFDSREDVCGVVHTHPKFGIALAASGMQLGLLNQDGFFFDDGVPVFSDFVRLIETLDDGRRIAEALGGSRGLFLLNHGIVVVGEDVASATVGALMLERACEIQLLAPSARAATHEEAKAIAANRLAGARLVFEYHARRLNTE